MVTALLPLEVFVVTWWRFGWGCAAARPTVPERTVPPAPPLVEGLASSSKLILANAWCLGTFNLLLIDLDDFDSLPKQSLADSLDDLTGVLVVRGTTMDSFNAVSSVIAGFDFDSFNLAFFSFSAFFADFSFSFSSLVFFGSLTFSFFSFSGFSFFLSFFFSSLVFSLSFVFVFLSDLSYSIENKIVKMFQNLNLIQTNLFILFLVLLFGILWCLF